MRYPPARGRFVSIVIPARNEAETIETVVTSILASTYAPFEVIVVDDRSTDATAALVARLAERDGRVRLVRGAELPAGWYGKPWACEQGWRAARGDLLLFTDADTVHAPALLAHAVGALEAEDAALLTIAPRQLAVTFWERAVMPQIWFLLGVRFHPHAVNRAKRARDVIANGQFILVTRADYERVGTHAVVKHEVAEDLALAQAYFRRGAKVWFAFAESLMATRMYRSLPQLVEGWSKNVYLGGRRSFPDEPVLRALVPVMLAIAMLFWLVPPVTLVAALAGGSLVPGLAAGAVVLPATVAVILSALFWMLLSGAMGMGAFSGLAYPLGALMTLYIVLRSTWRGHRRVEWRGRTYDSVEGG